MTLEPHQNFLFIGSMHINSCNTNLRKTRKLLGDEVPAFLCPRINRHYHHHCRFRRNRPTADQISCIRHTLEKKWEYNETVHQIFADFKKAYDSVGS
jgi:hypothetical protein